MSPPMSCAARTRAASRETRNDPRAITSCCTSQSAAEVSSSGREMDRPALLTTRATPPNASTAAAIAAAVLAFGGVDLVVNNAGLSISRPLLETSAADWDVQHDVMARGSFLVSREAARVLAAQDMGGDIVY